MSTKKEKKQYILLVSDSFGKTQENGTFEIAFRRWLVREIEEGRMSAKEAIERFNINPLNGASLIIRGKRNMPPK